MTGLERIAEIRHTGEFRIEAVRKGHAVNFYGNLYGTDYKDEVYYISDIYAKPKGNSRLDCERWAHANGVKITA